MPYTVTQASLFEKECCVNLVFLTQSERLNIYQQYAKTLIQVSKNRCLLASFPGSPGTRIYIAQRAWYLFYVSMT